MSMLILFQSVSGKIRYGVYLDRHGDMATCPLFLFEIGGLSVSVFGYGHEVKYICHPFH